MKHFTVLSFVLFSAVVLSAQTAPPNASPSSTGGVLGGMIVAPAGMMSISPSFVSSIGPGAPGGVITGAPYSAEQVTEHVQTLADGTHITEPAQTTKLYRDSAGRTRTERSVPVPPGVLARGSDAPSFIEIFDPVAGARYTLEPKNHTAHRMSMPSLAPPPPPPPRASGNGAPASRMIQLQPAQLPAQSTSTSQAQTPRPQFSRESLGTQTIEGVLAEGSRTTVTYPIGAVGNDRPITTTMETWTSPELKMVVVSKNSDPRSGESTTRLTNMSRSEPDPSLFQIPADYEIIEPPTPAKQ
jgi:hypothetical protein